MENVRNINISNRLVGLGILFVILNAIMVLTKIFFDPDIAVIFGLAGVGIVVVFSFYHGVKRYNWRTMIFFFLAIFVISWSYESLSILTGFPFGHYHYTDWWSPMLGLVPISIMPAYFAMGYLSWTFASIFLDKRDAGIKGSDIILIPVLASFIMVMWDICMDPFNSTISQFWIWHDGGVYFGVPFVNFLGWYLCVFTFYLAFALYLRFNKTINSKPTKINKRMFWMLPALLYGTNAIEFLGNMTRESVEVVAENGYKYWTGDIYGTLGLMTIFTMLFVVFYGVVRTVKSKDLE